jgi:hypothetical protein
MKLAIFDPSELAKQYIDNLYNRKTKHSALNYLTTKEFNNQINYKNVT